MALRALLEPEGPASGRLAQRLAMICAAPEGRAELAERVARTVALERAIVAGATIEDDQAAALMEEISEHLRAILRDVLCGHLDEDLVAVADELLSDAVEAAQAGEAPQEEASGGAAAAGDEAEETATESAAPQAAEPIPTPVAAENSWPQETLETLG
jgi:hypothetical protein